jgi:hypothetical protein
LLLALDAAHHQRDDVLAVRVAADRDRCARRRAEEVSVEERDRRVQRVLELVVAVGRHHAQVTGRDVEVASPR